MDGLLLMILTLLLSVPFWAIAYRWEQTILRQAAAQRRRVLARRVKGVTG